MSQRRVVSAETRNKMSEAQRKRYGTDPNSPTGRKVVCEMIKKHHVDMINDPERLTTEFMQKIIKIDCNIEQSTTEGA